MPLSIDAILGKTSAGQDLAQEEMAAAVEGIMRGEWSEPQMAILLTALHHKGPTVAEIAGAAQAMRRHMTPIHSTRTGIVDTCGTGGSGSGTFNISTTAALVAAAAGVPVAKHGNRSITSRTGSADVLSALGVQIDAPTAIVEACLDRLGICFCFAPRMHPSMKHVAPARKQLGFPTIFNILGPLSNPAGATRQLIGVGKPHLRPLLAEALVRLGTERAFVVHGADGQDEVTLAGETYVTEATPQGTREFIWRPEDFGLPHANLDALQAADPQASAAMVRQVLAGQPGPPRDIVLANAAATLWLANQAPTLPAATTQAAQALDTGAAANLLERWKQLSSQ